MDLQTAAANTKGGTCEESGHFMEYGNKKDIYGADDQKRRRGKCDTHRAQQEIMRKGDSKLSKEHCANRCQESNCKGKSTDKSC